MAKILYGPVVAEARGSVAGTTYSRNTYGPYMRNKASPVQPQSPNQVAQRASFTAMTQRWRDTLSAAQRDAWNDYAAQTPLVDAFGNKIQLKGNAMYVRFNALWDRIGETPVDDGPVTPGEAPMLDCTLAGDTTNGIQLTAYSPLLLTADRILILQCAATVAQSRNFYNGPFSMSTYQPGDVVLPYTIIAPANVAIGERWFFQIRAFVSDGRTGPPAIYRVDITT